MLENIFVRDGIPFRHGLKFEAVGVVVVVVVVVMYTFRYGLTFERLYRFASYLEGS